MKDHRKKDKKLQRLADNVIKEFKELKKFERELLAKNNQEMQRLEEEYHKRKGELIEQSIKIQMHVKKISRPRMEVVDYLTDNIPKQDINLLKISF